MRTFGYLGSCTIAGADREDRPKRPEPTMKKDGYTVIARACDDPCREYQLDRRRGTFMSPTRDNLFKTEE